MTDQATDARIRERFATIDRVVSHPGDRISVVHARIARRRRRRRARMGAVAIGCALVAVVAVLAWQINGDPSRRVHVITNPTIPTLPGTGPLEIVTEPDGVEVLPSPPLDVRGDSAAVWTGRKLVVWGGDVEAFNMGLPGPDRSYRDGAAYNPATRTWRMLAPSPLPESTDTPTAVMTDRGVVVVRERATAVWDPAADEWHQLEDVPFSCSTVCSRPGLVRDLTLVDSSLVSYSASVALDVESGRWRELPLPPRQFERFSVASTGQELVVIGGDSSVVRNTGALAFDVSTGAWRELATPPNLTQQALAAGWDGARVVAVDYEGDAAAYHPQSDSWSELPSIPARFSEWSPFLRASAGRSVVFMAHAIAVLGTDGMWVPVPYGDVAIGYGAVVSAGRTVFVLGIDSEQHLRLASIDLDRLVAQPPRLQVGIASAGVPDGSTLTASGFESIGISGTVRIRIANASGRECDLTSTYNRGVETADRERVSIPMRDRVAEWYRTSDSTHWETMATTSDTVVVECSDPALAEQVVRSVDFPIAIP